MSELLTMSLMRLVLLKLTHMWACDCGGHWRSRKVDLSFVCLDRSTVPQTSHPFSFSVPIRQEMKYLEGMVKCNQDKCQKYLISTP